jgi:hypothetical protein
VAAELFLAFWDLKRSARLPIQENVVATEPEPSDDAFPAPFNTAGGSAFVKQARLTAQIEQPEKNAVDVRSWQDHGIFSSG